MNTYYLYDTKFSIKIFIKKKIRFYHKQWYKKKETLYNIKKFEFKYLKPLTIELLLKKYHNKYNDSIASYYNSHKFMIKKFLEEIDP